MGTAPIRVFQVGSGNVGSEMIRRIATQPDLELIGVHCYSPEKIGKDTGQFAGLAPNGVKFTGTVEEIIAAKPDVLTFHGVFPDEDLYVKVLEAGIDIVTTADWITGWHRDKNHPHPSGKPVTQLLAEAAAKGGATFYGTGMNPGLNQILGVVCSADVAEIENVTTIESVDVSCHHSKDTWIEVGYGQPVDDPEIPAKLEKYTRVFADSVYMMADCFDLTLDEVTFSYELGACTKDVDLGWYTLPKGSLGGNYIKYQGMVDGVPRVETHLEWQMTPHTDPSWNVKGCYITQIKGDPCIYNKHMIFPKPGVDLSNPDNFASIGMTVTGMPALAAIRSVVAAPPGLLTSADLSLRGFAGRFKKWASRVLAVESALRMVKVVGARAAVPLRWRDPRRASICEFLCPPTIFDQFVMRPAGEGEVVDIGQAARRPLVEMMHLAPIAGCVAAGVGAAPVFRVEHHALVRRRDAAAPAEIQRPTRVLVEHRQVVIRVTRHADHVAHRQQRPAARHRPAGARRQLSQRGRHDDRDR